VYEIETGKETASYTYDATAQRWARTLAVDKVDVEFDVVESFEIPFPPKPPWDGGLKKPLANNGRLENYQPTSTGFSLIFRISDF